MALTPTDRLDSAVIETRPASPTYRDPALPEALALTTFNAAPVVAPPASPHNVVLVGFLSIPIILLVLGSLVGRHILRRSDAIENPYEALGRIADLAGATYDPVRGYCPSASAPVPPAVPRARLYTSAPGDWLTDKDAGAGFACLGFSRTQAQLYQYSYIASPDRRSFDVIVRGDLNGDGVSSTLRTHGTIGPNGRTSRSPYPDETTGE
jgi:hypothetical protein